jgi:hypothetical protein
VGYEGELIERGVETLLQGGMESALAAVEARWSTAGYPLSIPRPANWCRGYRADMLERPSTDYPFVVTIVSERNPESGQAGRWGPEDVTHSLLIGVFVVAESEDLATSIAHRYAEAVVDILQGQRSIEGYEQRHREPAVSLLADNEKHLTAGGYGDSYDTADTDYIRYVEISQGLKGEP